MMSATMEVPHLNCLQHFRVRLLIVSRKINWIPIGFKCLQQDEYIAKLEMTFTKLSAISKHTPSERNETYHKIVFLEPCYCGKN